MAATPYPAYKSSRAGESPYPADKSSRAGESPYPADKSSWAGESSYPAANKKAGRDARLFFVLNITARR
jgi:hypothetical protein